jgi:isoamylase
MSGRAVFHLMANAYWEPLHFELPQPPGGRQERWRRLIDTAKAAPDDIVPPGEAPAIVADRYQVRDRSVVLLLAGND